MQEEKGEYNQNWKNSPLPFVRGRCITKLEGVV